MKRLHHQELADRSVKRLQQLKTENPALTYQQLASQLHREGFRTIRDCRWTRDNLYQLVHRLRNDYSPLDTVGYGASMAKAAPQLWCLQ